MARCLQLAINGRSNVFPNPVVGAVIVHAGRIIGEGFHSACGSSHAEVIAIQSVADKSLLNESTLYVSLEPCSHYGKTPPCADLIIKWNIPEVVIGIQDPFPEVAGKGIARLRAAGIKVHVGVLEDECRKINNRFFTFYLKKRPFVILKWAQTADGFIDRLRDSIQNPPAIISNKLTQIQLHKFRSQVSGILVGTATALKDNPALTVRLWKGRNPVRIVIDRKLRIPGHYHLFDGQVQTLVFTDADKHSDNENIEYITTDFSADIIPQILEQLYRRNIQSVLVEGGKITLDRFIACDCWDEARIEIGAMRFGKGVPTPVCCGEVMKIQKYGDATILSIKNNRQQI
ncbi:MAG: bifunctional diaminohydroxyphosphoribosylaminopyrimidine deaminase/5-amino-6-(5-phosphoribosylamino)uracil reductase RibD [Bacteroidales bacterium]|nr:bifunctional diaminohydroxyphosphoribosylaminopyrimidine deaminase/5-amino-6-(5-phosphoribosylamino)uracil reductase RibD [Bacteroidales bacterium]